MEQIQNQIFVLEILNNQKDYSEFDLKIILPNIKKKLIKKIKIPLLGIHNIRNSVAASAFGYYSWINSFKY
jgi:UDP-N-acetylmuramate--alanine ligase